MIDQDAFFKEYRISKEDFESTELEWTQLEEIFADYKSKYSELLATGRLISEHLSQIKEVHSLKVRVKDPEHLIEKIIRKKVDDSAREITVTNYLTEITDLIGVRALHLFKDDWEEIHKPVMRIWDLHEQPTAYIRSGDNEERFKGNGCQVVPHKAGYRSVHYLVKTQATKQLSIAEIQVRTLFEEGWSEIDHRMRYPYELDNVILSDYLAVFNRLAGNADEMGTYVKVLKENLVKMEEAFKEELAERERQKAEMIKDLKSVTEKLQKETEEKKKLQKVIETLEKSKPVTNPSYGPLSSVPIGAYTFSFCNMCGKSYEAKSSTGLTSPTCPDCVKLTSTGVRALFPSLTTGTQMKKCRNCGREYDTSRAISSTCPHCHTFTL